MEGLFGSSDEEGWAPGLGGRPPNGGPWDGDGFISVGIRGCNKDKGNQWYIYIYRFIYIYMIIYVYIPLYSLSPIVWDYGFENRGL